MKEYIEARILNEARYMIDEKCTIRQVAKKFGVCKNTVHQDLTVKLAKIDFELYASVLDIIDTNKVERATRGGMATKERYRKVRENM